MANRRWRKRKRRAVNPAKANDLGYKVKNAVANLGRRCGISSVYAREFVLPILSSIHAGVDSITCRYCYQPLTLPTVSWDHIIPLSRGGDVWLPNIAVCCVTCNKTKGSLTEEEYCSLLELMIPWPEEAKNNVCRRLRLGGSFFGRFKRRK